MLRAIHGRVHERLNTPPVPGILVSVLDDVCTVLTALSEFMGHYEEIVPPDVITLCETWLVTPLKMMK